MCHSYETAGYILEFLVHHLIKLYDIANIKKGFSINLVKSSILGKSGTP